MTIILDGSTGIVSDSSASNPAMTAKGNGSDVEGYIQLNCRVNSHGVKLKSPPHSSGQSYTMVLPDNQVAADKFLKVKSITGSGVTAVGQLEYADVSGGKFVSYAIIADRKAQNASSGTFSSGGWRTRDLNTELLDPDGIVSLSNNEFTLQAGSYLIIGSAPALEVDSHMAKLNNVTDSDDNIGQGTIEFSLAGSSSQTRSFFSTRVTISSAKAFSVLHRCTTTNSGNGFGITGNLDFEIYTIVEIYKEA